MKAFASWSGGKDCMLALYRTLNKESINVTHLLNMCENDGEHSRSHGIKQALIKKQAKAMDMDIIQEPSPFNGYETAFKAVIEQLKDNGITAGVFGDIYLMEHRVWIERVCSEMNIEPIFPLWKNDTKKLLKEFVDAGFKALTVAVNTKILAPSWLGRELDSDFYNEIIQLEGIDPCAENGEYHSFVYDGPIFKQAVHILSGETRSEAHHIFLTLNN